MTSLRLRAVLVMTAAIAVWIDTGLRKPLQTEVQGNENLHAELIQDGSSSESQRQVRPELAGVVRKDQPLTGQQSDSQQSKGKPSQENQEWRAEVPESRWNWLILHHSATASGSVETIHDEHRRRTDGQGNQWLGIGYHFVIGNGNGMPDGHVAATFRWEQQIHGAHSGHAIFNARGVGICLIGNFEISAPTVKQLAAVKRLVRVLAVRHQIPADRVIGHSSVKATSCPGKKFPMQEVREVIAKMLQG